jgi:[NiFe] hydrogenase diaphorase moiety large subunit
MSELQASITRICADHSNDRNRMMDIVRAVQAKSGAVTREAMAAIAQAVGCRRVEVESVVTFYAFLSAKAKGKVIVRLCNDVVDRMNGLDDVAKALSKALGIGFGATTADGAITLEYAPCLGLCDQAPAALVNEVPVTSLTPDGARKLAADLKAGVAPAKLVKRLGDGNNAHALVRSMVNNNLRQTGPVVFAPMEPGKALKKAVAMTPQEVIREVKTSRLRGRGGAGFPAGMKWEFTRNAEGSDKVVIANADEGEPGTFKDRVILTECPDLVFEGMAIAGYAIGATTGLLYLRGEYAYLAPYLDDVLARRRAAGLLGKAITGKPGFDFDIRLQLGAGAYICGEETALISSAEGLRGDPKNRPPFPAQKGYLGRPTSVNNVETFCAAARVIEQGAGWFVQLGSPGSPGTKVLSVSGDCSRPGVYEVPFGTTLKQLLDLVGAENVQAVQVGGPSGQLVGTDQFERKICYDHLATGGAMVVFNQSRKLLSVVAEYLDFFCEESCGYCTPCRVGNVLLKERVGRIIAGRGEPADLVYLQQLGAMVKTASRCGLGQTSPNPVLTALKSFPALFAGAVKENKGGRQPSFNLAEATADCAAIAGHKSVHDH